MAIYLDLYHGRKTPEEDMGGWGFNGPVIGPLLYIHVAYMDTFRLGFKYVKDAKRCGFEGLEDVWLDTKGGLINFQGNYYGDWSVTDLTAAEVAEMRKEKGRVNAISYKKYLKALGAKDIED